MNFFRQYTLAVIAAVLLPWCCCGRDGLQIGDATGGTGLSALRSALFELSRKKRDIPQTFSGRRMDFAAEALVLYSGMGNPLGSLTIAQLKEIWQTPRPEWRKYNGEANEIHRLGLTMNGGGFTEARFLGGTLKREGVYRSGAIQRAWLFCTPAALLCGPAVAERPGNIKIINVNGVFPSKENILSGKYPLNLRYELLFRQHSRRTVQAFLQLLATPAYTAQIRESGLILNFTAGGTDEKKP